MGSALATRAQSRAQKAPAATARLRTNQIRPRPSPKLRAGFPASATDTGSHAAAARSEASDMIRSAVPRTLRATAVPATAMSPRAARALPIGSPPGSSISRYDAPHTSESIENNAMAKSATMIIFPLFIVAMTHVMRPDG